MDGAKVKLDYILTDARACFDTMSHDQLIPTGLDHRCVHCLLRWRGVRPSPRNRRLNLKNWMPILDTDGGPSLFQNSLREMLDGNSTISCEVLEHFLLESGKQKIFISPGPMQVLTGVEEVDCKGVGRAGLRPGFGSSWDD